MTPLKPVQGSSQIAAYGYDAASHVLAVQYVNSPAYVYHFRGVSPETAEKIDQADSKGKAFASLIRGKHEFTRIEVAAGETAEQP